MPAPGLGFTPHTVLSASCNWPKIPLAPNSASTMPNTVARMPLEGLAALAAMLLMTSIVL